jgi:hypothetical protein
MKKTFILVIIAIFLASCGNKKTDQVSENADEKLICRSVKEMGSNVPVRVCQTVAERRAERKRAQEARSGS